MNIVRFYFSLRAKKFKTESRGDSNTVLDLAGELRANTTGELGKKKKSMKVGNIRQSANKISGNTWSVNKLHADLNNTTVMEWQRVMLC